MTLISGASIGLLLTSCSVTPNTPEAASWQPEPIACPTGHRALARCLGEGDSGALACLDDSDPDATSLHAVWRSTPGGPRHAASWVGAELARVSWARGTGPEHVNSTLLWPHMGSTWTLTLHTRLATTRTPARHAGVLRAIGERSDHLRCSRVGPHDPLSLRATPARRLPWSPGW